MVVYEFPLLLDFGAVLRHAAEADGGCLEEFGVRVPEILGDGAQGAQEAQNPQQKRVKKIKKKKV